MNFPHIETRIRNRIAELETVAEIVGRFCATHKLPNQFLVAFGVSLDEAVSNIIHYAYPDGSDHSILVRLDYQPGSVAATVEDDGRPFDPTSVPALDLSAIDRERGFGVHFIKNLMDDVRYVREGRINRLKMCKRIEVTA